jgi:hypothetical protein
MIGSCKKRPSYLGPLQINTDKAIYQINDPIIVEVNNLTDSVAVHTWSNLHNFNPITYKYENESWTGYLAEYRIENIHCCKELLPGSKEKDTLHIDFEKGIYRIEYNFTMRPVDKNQIFYSNIFIVE